MIASASTPDRLQDAVRILRAAGYLQRRAREACASEADTAHIRRTCADAAWVLLNGRPETPSLPEAVHALLAAGTLPVSGLHQLVVDACGLLKQTSASDHDLAAQTFKCIVRPLGEFAGITAAPEGSGYEGALRSWQELAEHVASMDSGLNTSPLLFEALAGLQRLHRVVIPSGKGTSSRLHIGYLGPYLLTGCANLVDHLGQTISSTRPAALCRCGHSKAKPFCDGSHVGAEFITAKDPRRVPDRRDVYEGQAAIVFDNRGLCAHAGFCTDRLNGVFHVDREPFVTPSGGRLDDIIRAVRRCPSGALSLGMDGQETRGHVDQPREPTVEVSRNGPYRVTGAIPIFDEIGAPVARADGASLEHCSLCRCGSSLNKPFCSGMHWSVNFSDPAPTTEPTLFEWAGGYPALLDMTTIFYGKYVPQDPLIGPLFADMSPDHPERVAAWLSEVFGGPKLYSERYGGYARMISQHVGKNIKPEQRARWASLMAQSADDAGLPADAEFRAAFRAYIEWGSRIAVENSTAGAVPPPNMPVPRWWWVCNATPGSRQSALAPEHRETSTWSPPKADEPIDFDAHIKPLFRPMDRNSMKFAFDLWNEADVVRHGAAIASRLQEGTMPCDGRWPDEKLAVFKAWLNGLGQSAKQ